jgi:hypothetical protein
MVRSFLLLAFLTLGACQQSVTSIYLGFGPLVIVPGLDSFILRPVILNIVEFIRFIALSSYLRSFNC